MLIVIMVILRPMTDPKSKGRKSDPENTTVGLYDQNMLEKQHRITVQFGEDGTIFAKHLIVLVRTWLVPGATLATLATQNQWIWS